jgi:hypothetical protein
LPPPQGTLPKPLLRSLKLLNIEVSFKVLSAAGRPRLSVSTSTVSSALCLLRSRRFKEQRPAVLPITMMKLKILL